MALCFRCDLQIGYICLVSAKIAVRKSPAKQEANSAKYLNKEILWRLDFVLPLAVRDTA